jgi:hypothetical protein
VIGRLARLTAGYLAASLAAGSAIALGLVLMLLLGLLQEGRSAGTAASLALYWLLLAFIIFPLIIKLALLPALVVIAVAETARLRSTGFYACAGAIGAVLCWAFFVREGRVLQTLPGLRLTLAPDRVLVECALVLVASVAGLIGGLVTIGRKP